MVEYWLNVFADWILIPFIIIYGFMSWSRDNPDKQIFMDPENKENQSSKTSSDKSQDNHSS